MFYTVRACLQLNAKHRCGNSKIRSAVRFSQAAMSTLAEGFRPLPRQPDTTLVQRQDRPVLIHPLRFCLLGRPSLCLFSHGPQVFIRSVSPPHVRSTLPRKRDQAVDIPVQCAIQNWWNVSHLRSKDINRLPDARRQRHVTSTQEDHRPAQDMQDQEKIDHGRSAP